MEKGLSRRGCDGDSEQTLQRFTKVRRSRRSSYSVPALRSVRRKVGGPPDSEITQADFYVFNSVSRLMEWKVQ